jgi:hypothetical protein
MAYPFITWPLGLLETLVSIGAGAAPTERHRLRFVERAGNFRTAAAISLTSLVAGAGTAGFIGMIADPSLGPIAGAAAVAAGLVVGGTIWLIDVTTVEFIDRMRAESRLRWRGFDFLPTRARGLKLLSVLPLRGSQAIVTSSLAGIGLALFIFAGDVNDRLIDEARTANAPLMATQRANANERIDALKLAWERAKQAVTDAAKEPAAAVGIQQTTENPLEAARHMFDQRRHELDEMMKHLVGSMSTQAAITAEAKARLACENSLISCNAAKAPVTGIPGPGPNGRQAAKDVRDSQNEEASILAKTHTLQQQIDTLEAERTATMTATQSRELLDNAASQQAERVMNARHEVELATLRTAEAGALATWSAAKSTFDQDVASSAKLTGNLKEPRKGVTAKLWALWQLRHEPGNAAIFLGLTLLAMVLELAPLITAILYSTPRFGPLLEVVELERQIQDELRKEQWRNRQQK